MSIAGASIVIVGEVRATADLTLDGRIRGPVSCEDSLLTVPVSAEVEGPLLARDIIVFGRVEGQLIATEVVDLRPGCMVTGSIVAPSLILHDGARFTGRVDPNQLTAALSVARFQRKQRDAQAG